MQRATTRKTLAFTGALALTLAGCAADTSALGDGADLRTEDPCGPNAVLSGLVSRLADAPADSDNATSYRPMLCQTSQPAGKGNLYAVRFDPDLPTAGAQDWWLTVESRVEQNPQAAAEPIQAEVFRLEKRIGSYELTHMNGIGSGTLCRSSFDTLNDLHLAELGHTVTSTRIEPENRELDLSEALILEDKDFGSLTLAHRDGVFGGYYQPAEGEGATLRCELANADPAADAAEG